jgi:hypothetical protein
MNEQLRQVRDWMTIRGHTPRYLPATGIPAAERFAHMERLLRESWSLAASLGIDLGRTPTIIYTGAPISPPSVILGRLTSTLAELLSIYHSTGLSPTLTRGLLRFTSNPTNAGTPNFNTVIDETFSDEDSDQILKS